MAKKKETRQLSLLEMKGLCKLFEDNCFEDDIIDVDYGDRLTDICVDEDEYAVMVHFISRENGPRWGVPIPTCIREIKVGGLKLRVKDCDEVIEELEILTSGLQFPDDYDLLEELKDAISCSLEAPDYEDPEEQFSNDWSYEEIVDEIENALSCDAYIELDGAIYPLHEDVETFLANHFDNEQDREGAVYTELTPHEAAEKLAENVSGE